jgi:hypothetical protein
MVPLGWPVRGYGTVAAMGDGLTQFMSDHCKPVLDDYLDTDLLEFVYYNDQLMLHEAKEQALMDMLLAIGSLLFIFGYILFHTR